MAENLYEGEQDRRSAAEAAHTPRQVPQRTGADPSNTPVEEVTQALDPDEDREVRGLVRREVAERPELLARLNNPTDSDAASA